MQGSTFDSFPESFDRCHCGGEKQGISMYNTPYIRSIEVNPDPNEAFTLSGTQGSQGD